MGYLTNEWEVKDLMKKSDKSLATESKYLLQQWNIKLNMLYEYGLNIAKGNEPPIPLWMIKEDINSINEQMIRVMDEIKRRFLP